MKNILAADIGGTHSRFAHFCTDEEGALSLLETRWLNTAGADSFLQLIDNLRSAGMSLRPESADIVVIAIAGPVERGVRSSPPLIPWDIDLSSAHKDYGFREYALINDFIAQAFACLTEVGFSAKNILPGEPETNALKAVIGAGTGLGHAALVPDGKGDYLAVPSETGHANFAFVSRREYEFQEFLLRERGERYVTGNTVVSGQGLSYIHRFLTGEELPPAKVAERLARSPETLEWAARFYGRACRNFALGTLSLGGVYIAGGVAAKTPELVTHSSFEDEFRSSDTLFGLLKKIPIYLITDENSGLWGSALFGVRRLKHIIK
jgi:glucokinase